MTEEQFIKTYCHGCGTQRCEGPGSEWFDGCRKRWNLDGMDSAAEIEKLNDKIRELGRKIILLTKRGKWIKASCSEKDGDAHCSECNHWDWSDCKYCSKCGAFMEEVI